LKARERRSRYAPQLLARVRTADSPHLRCLSDPRGSRTRQVLPNAHWGIRGGYTVSVLWVFLERVQQWEARLPDALHEQIAVDSELNSGEFRNFPHFLTGGQSASRDVQDLCLTLPQAHLVSQLATSYVTGHEDLFRQMLGSSRAPPPADEPPDYDYQVSPASRRRRDLICGGGSMLEHQHRTIKAPVA
jgi:hypothetical protein